MAKTSFKKFYIYTEVYFSIIDPDEARDSMVVLMTSIYRLQSLQSEFFLQITGDFFTQEGLERQNMFVFYCPLLVQHILQIT